jgi:hypothetical protein
VNHRLPAAVVARPYIISCWGFATGSEPLAAVVDRLHADGVQAEAIAARAYAAFDASEG